MNKIKDVSFIRKFIVSAISLAVLSVCMVLICTVSNYAVAEEKANESNAATTGQYNSAEENDLDSIINTETKNQDQEPAANVKEETKSNKQLKIKFDCSQSTAPEGSYSIDLANYKNLWDEATQSIILPENTTYYKVDAVSVDRSYMFISVYTGEANDHMGIFIFANCYPNMKFYDWGYRGGEQTTDSTFYPKFEKIGDVQSGKISGKVMREDGNGPVSGVNVKIQDNQTSEVMWNTFTTDDGSFVINNVDPKFIIDVKKGLYPNLELCFCHPDFVFSTKKMADCSWTYDAGSQLYILENNEVVLPDAQRINFYGSDNHQSFNYTLDYIEVLWTGEILQQFTNRYNVLSVSFPDEYFANLKIAKFEITENGIIKGEERADINSDSYACLTVLIEPVCDEGYELDYVELNGSKYYKNQEIFTDDGESTFNSTVHYKHVEEPLPPAPDQPEHTFASTQTGDMGIYVIVALAVMAISAGVVFAARRRIN